MIADYEKLRGRKIYKVEAVRTNLGITGQDSHGAEYQES
jgi:hypothetical protein